MPCNLSTFNTLKLVSRAAGLAYYRHESQLLDLNKELKKHESAFVLGGGSNIILMPLLKSFVIKVETSGLRVWKDTGKERIIEVAAGQSWHGLVAHCVEKNWGGLENLALIPGTVGAAPVQNIGAYGVELAQYLHSIEVWDFQNEKKTIFTKEECQFDYRNSVFKQAKPGRWLILSVRLCLPKRWEPRLDYPDLKNYFEENITPKPLHPADIFQAICTIRQSKLPDTKQLPNAGSFFKNPVVSASVYRQLLKKWPKLVAYPVSGDTYKLAAGWLIEQAGWKGRALGPVAMHKRQALVLVNTGLITTACDVLKLADTVATEVEKQFGVRLEREPVLVQ